MKTFFNKIHTDSFRWYDEILIVLLLAAAMMIICGQIIGALVIAPFNRMIEKDSTGYWEMFSMYFGFIGTWVVFMIAFLIVKKTDQYLRLCGLPQEETISNIWELAF